MQFLIDLILGLFKSPTQSKIEPSPVAQPEIQTPNSEPYTQPEEPLIGSPTLTLDDWITSSGKYLDRANSPELTYDVRSAAMVLVDKINELGRRLKLGKLAVSSGFRPSKVNANIKGAAKGSGHLIGLSVDFLDADGRLDAILSLDSTQDLLAELQLWQEHPSKTNTWAHIDYVKRVDKDRPNCKKRQFMP